MSSRTGNGKRDTGSRKGARRGPSARRAAALAVAVAVPAAMLCPGLALAKTGDRQQPIEIQAENSSSVLTGDGEAVLRGNVRIDQGTLAIRADEATVVQRGGEVRRVVFTGERASLQQQADDGTMTRALARRIEYDFGTDVVELTGNVEVVQPRNTLRGERVTYDLATERLDAGGEGGPIRMVIQPRTDAAASDGDD